MIKEKLMGAWKLVSNLVTDEDGVTIHSMGEGATGLICYTNDGWMSVQIQAANRPRYDIPDMELGTDEQTLAVARSTFFYAGRVTVDEENQVVYHDLEFCLVPNWIGSRQKRYVRFEDDGNVLVLSTDRYRMGKDGKLRIGTLHWRKA
ncbi:lipocalin-like domain-containing protein [Papillibacter cinnamivorans]|uniref:Lipocalin-like domain-containing protein n=1 Tax=Papillibacter cinnamivorans DSM 12816 TaxID=1122930 RepID=A0A1W2C020_9FIRM|nr:lipocalin-like domain-containing protein [Papillibacter cinnamivorans]SMC78441.1 Lipocalin-like domain-containing protein [Papillibacter cinnamivorans DSM 12816]